jgi:hypothetical protein
VHLTLLVPELIWPEPADQFTLGKLSAPGLQWLIARANLAKNPRRPFENVLASQFGVDDAPFGALRRLGEDQPTAPDGHWLCADPVHLRFHHERIILADAGAFELDMAEAQALLGALNQTFADIGEFHLGHDARRWYIKLHAAVDHPVAPLSAIAGRLIDGELKGEALPLTRWLNEVQMFLHGHPVNETRQYAGKPAINSLWLWGGGTLKTMANTGNPLGLSSVFSDNPLAIGLARTAGIPVHAKPAMLAAALAQAGERPLVVLDQLLPRVLYEDGEGWRSAFEQLDNDWFAPLQKALGKQVDRISLIAPTIYGDLHYTVDAAARWKFWKSAPAIQPMAEALAGKTAQ